MGVDREIFAVEAPEHPDALFDPDTLVVGQEHEIFLKRKVPAYVSYHTFVFHHKGGTLPSYKGREDVMRCHNNYLEALPASAVTTTATRASSSVVLGEAAATGVVGGGDTAEGEDGDGEYEEEEDDAAVSATQGRQRRQQQRQHRQQQPVEEQPGRGVSYVGVGDPFAAMTHDREAAPGRARADRVAGALRLGQPGSVLGQSGGLVSPPLPFMRDPAADEPAAVTTVAPPLSQGPPRRPHFQTAWEANDFGRLREGRSRPPPSSPDEELSRDARAAAEAIRQRWMTGRIAAAANGRLAGGKRKRP